MWWVLEEEELIQQVLLVSRFYNDAVFAYNCIFASSVAYCVPIFKDIIHNDFNKGGHINVQFDISTAKKE